MTKALLRAVLFFCFCLSPASKAQEFWVDDGVVPEIRAAYDDAWQEILAEADDVEALKQHYGGYLVNLLNNGVIRVDAELKAGTLPVDTMAAFGNKIFLLDKFEPAATLGASIRQVTLSNLEGSTHYRGMASNPVFVMLRRQDTSDTIILDVNLRPSLSGRSYFRGTVFMYIDDEAYPVGEVSQENGIYLQLYPNTRADGQLIAADYADSFLSSPE